MLKALIIDDEKLARDLIKSHLKAEHDIRVVGECADGFEGFKMIQTAQPDLIFLDIQMPKLTGFEMLELLESPPQIIFSTAFDQYALKAFEKNAVDYLLKPYNGERFREAVQKVREKINRNEQPRIQELVEGKQKEEDLHRLVVKVGSRIQIIPLEEIHYFEADDDYVSIHTSDGKFLKQMTMKSLEEGLDPEKFIRVHRSFLVSTESIDKLEAYQKGSHIIKTRQGAQIPVSKSGYQRIREILGF